MSSRICLFTLLYWSGGVTDKKIFIMILKRDVETFRAVSFTQINDLDLVYIKKNSCLKLIWIIEKETYLSNQYSSRIFSNAVTVSFIYQHSSEMDTIRMGPNKKIPNIIKTGINFQIGLCLCGNFSSSFDLFLTTLCFMWCLRNKYIINKYVYVT
jgi:hypothetical protein